MDPRDWYAGIDVSHWHSAYALACCLCHSEETAKQRIIPTAVEIAYKSLRRRTRRERDSATGWKIMLSDAQLLQIGILEAAEREGMVPLTGPWLPVHCRPYAAYAAAELLFCGRRLRTVVNERVQAGGPEALRLPGPRRPHAPGDAGCER